MEYFINNYEWVIIVLLFLLEFLLLVIWPLPSFTHYLRVPLTKIIVTDRQIENFKSKTEYQYEGNIYSTVFFKKLDTNRIAIVNQIYGISILDSISITHSYLQISEENKRLTFYTFLNYPMIILVAFVLYKITVNADFIILVIFISFCIILAVIISIALRKLYLEAINKLIN